MHDKNEGIYTSKSTKCLQQLANTATLRNCGANVTQWHDHQYDNHSCPGLHQLLARLLQFIALWNCRQSTKTTTVVQNAAAGLVIGTQPKDHITPVLQSLHWLPVWQRILFELVVLVHKCLNEHAPAYLADDCRLICRRRSGLRLSSSTTKLEVPPTRTTSVSYTHLTLPTNREV